MKLDLDWAVSFDPPVSPARDQAVNCVAGSTVFHSPYFSSASDATAWAGAAGWPWHERRRCQWYKWQEEPEKEEEKEKGEEDKTASSASTLPPSLDHRQDLEKEGKEEHSEENKKPAPIQAPHHRRRGLSYSEVVKGP
ncbi:hypothetical protein F5Y06DRAFT_276332 [Hypoxylon sp. FL0890]|nr:hypothetical protein F5Y06DRAFT_276332 [Hypoxylon sp. FL0890]